MHLERITIHPDRYPVRDHYPFTLAVAHETPAIDFTTPVTFFVGENGSGKSTILRAIASRCGIHIWGEDDRPRLKPNPYERHLPIALDPVWTDGPVHGGYFDSQTFNSFAELVEEWSLDDAGQLAYYGDHSLVTLSHGQSLLTYFTTRYRRRGLYFLDEPETALSPKSQLALLDLLTTCADKGDAQFIIATHSPILMSLSGAVILDFDTAPVSPIRYEDTAHYCVFKRFMVDH